MASWAAMNPRTVNPIVKARKAMKTLVTLLAAAVLAACGSMPTGAQFGEVKHPDPFHSYID